MPRCKLFAFIVVITLAFGVAIVADALAGEKFKLRTVKYMTKWEQVNVGDEEGHVIAVYEGKGIETNMQGKKFMDGWLIRETGLMDINGKAGTWSAQGYGESTDRDGDKIFFSWEGRKDKNDAGKGTNAILKGTGKWQGIKGKGTWVASPGVDNRWYSDVELDLELPR